MDLPVTLVMEGATDAPVIERLVGDAGLVVGPEYVMYGKPGLDRSLGGYNKAARFSPWLVLRDLNSDEPCAPALRLRLLPTPSQYMRFHIAVREMEAWLLADAEGLSRFLEIPRTLVPDRPEEVPQPKVALINLARRSRRRHLREALVPESGSTAKVGPGYAAAVLDFATHSWRPVAAEERAPSLRRLRLYLRHLRRRQG